VRVLGRRGLLLQHRHRRQRRRHGVVHLPCPNATTICCSVYCSSSASDCHRWKKLGSSITCARKPRKHQYLIYSDESNSSQG
jgi:hypothetical protein